MRRGSSAVGRMTLVAVAVAVAETAWALYCAESNANIFVFYAVLVVASAAFWVPGFSQKRGNDIR